MKYSRVFQILGLGLFFSLFLGAGLHAQAVEGRVTWPSGEPVAGATTTLLDASFQTAAEGATDAEGRFRLSAPAAGQYIVVAAMEGYPSKMSDLFSIEEAGVVNLDLVFSAERVGEAEISAADTLSDAELLAAAIAESCEGRFIPSLHGIVFGQVQDASTGTPISDATAAIHRINPYAMVPGADNLSAQSDATGVYLICSAPAGEDLRIRASAEGTEGEWEDFNLRPGTMSRINLETPLNDPDQPGNILGRVQDQEWGQVISGVEISVKETGFQTESDLRGNFKIPNLPWGEYTVSFEHPSYGSHEQLLRVIGGRSHELEVHLPPITFEMEPIIVRARPRRWFGDMVGLQERIERGVGYIMTRKEIDQRQPVHLADMLRAVPGVDVVQSGSSITGRFTVQMRNAQNMLGQLCPPSVWVDGQKWRDANSAFTGILGMELEVVEVYTGPAEVPGEFIDSSTSCGAVIVWTRRGRTFGG